MAKKKHKVKFCRRKVKEIQAHLRNGKMGSANPSIQERFARMEEHWNRELQYREDVQTRRWDGREKPSS